MVIHIAIAFDQNYLMQLYALAASIIRNNRDNEISIHAIASGISIEEKAKLKSYVEHHKCAITFYSIDEALVKKLILTSNWTSAVYYRLFFPLLVPENVTRLLYLDTDIIINNELNELYNAHLDNYPVGAVYDCYVKKQPLIGIDREGDYFNSGVLLIDVAMWKDQMITQKTIDYLMNYPERIRFVDQCALNAILFKNWKKLPEKYNLTYSHLPDGMSFKRLKEFVRDKVVIHYTLQRPWTMLNTNRLEYLYHYYLNLSSFGRHFPKYVDYNWRKIPKFIKIKLTNIYFDIPYLPMVWRKIKPKT